MLAEGVFFCNRFPLQLARPGQEVSARANSPVARGPATRSAGTARNWVERQILIKAKEK